MVDTPEIKQIAVSELVDHPQNPRLFLREDVIDGIAAQLGEAGYFDPAHALLVRRVDGHYQIVRGHHRKAAAERAGLDTVPCWVREMSDEEAYMQLALGNVQGELSPLEIGVHALRVVDLEQGKDGRGLQSYASMIGKPRSNVSLYRTGAEVLRAATSYINVRSCLDKAQHLAAVHALPADLWPLLAQWVITPNGRDDTPSVNQTQEIVKEIQKLDAPEDWRFFLPLPDLAESYLHTKAPTPQTVKELWQLAASIDTIIEANSKRFDPARFGYTAEAFHDWLSGGIGSYAWNLQELQDYRRKVIAVAQEAQRPQPANAQAGEWYQLGKHLLYCGDTSEPGFYDGLPQSAFAFADPPYNAEAAVWDSGFVWRHDWLISKAATVAVTPGIAAIQSFFAHDTTMPYAWSIACWIKNGMTRGALGFGNWIYVALFGEQGLHRNAQDVIEVTIKTGRTEETEHKGRKPQELLERLIELFTSPGDTVIDPFLGSGTTLFAADKTGRRCIGGEINPVFCNEIIDRWQTEAGQEATRA